jgi:RNA polymerase sigma-70 factor, ECF subfamily
LDESSEHNLLESVRRFDEQALNTVYNAYYLLIYRYLYVHTGHRETAEDLTQQTFMRLLDALQAGNGPHSYLKAWLFRAATNLIIDDARAAKHRNHAPLDGVHAAITAELHLDAHIEVTEVRAALADLHPTQCAVITMRFFGEMSFEEIAHALGLTVGAVKAHQHRGLTALRNLLNRQGIL